MLCKTVLIILPDKWFFQLSYFIDHLRFGYKYRPLNLIFPKTFSEKISYLKLHYRHDLGSLVADKVAVREYIKKKIGEEYLIPLLAVYDNASQIIFGDLPQSFVLKTNHGSGWNIVCKNKDLLNKKDAINNLNRWLSWNAYYLSREWQYKNIKPMILCEQMLEYEINDYKIFCFNGKPEYIQVDLNRFSGHKRIFYNTNWHRQDFSLLYPISSINLGKPEKLDEMLNIARKLSIGFIFSRIDLYLHDNKIYFGEITLHPEGGNCPITPELFDYMMSDKLKINKPLQSLRMDLN